MMRYCTKAIAALIGGGLLLVSASLWAASVEVRALFSGSAMLVIDGKQRLLRKGQRSPEGVLLVDANSKHAVIEMDGQRHKLGVSRRISSTYKAAEKNTVHLSSKRGGHFVTPARINGRPVTVMVDTGATSVAMSKTEAIKLGIDYRKGTPITVSTANGLTQAYQVMLSSVSVGTVKVNNVEASITDGAFPQIILLGNSYLSKVQMTQENGVLILESKF
jgi:aspartyl protease family protein